jgi:hypothetical protein
MKAQTIRAAYRVDFSSADRLEIDTVVSRRGEIYRHPTRRPLLVGLLGMVRVLALYGFAFAGPVLLIASVALVVLESRYERGLMGVRRD